MATLFINALIVLLNCLLISATSDLKAEQFMVTNELIPEYRPGESTTITLDLVVKNVGTEDLHSSPDGKPHFYAHAYFADDVEEELAHEKSEHFNLTITDENVYGAFPQQVKVNLTAITGVITPSTDHCLHYTYLCVQIYPSKADANSTNDDFCLRLQVPPPGGVGNLFCTDLVIVFFNITSPDEVTYKADVKERITASIGIKNVGPVDLPFNDASSHWGIDLYLEGPEASKDLGYVRVSSDEKEKPHEAFYGSNHATSASNVVTVNDVSLDVELDKGNCEQYQEICIRLLPSVTARSDDTDDDEERCRALHSLVKDGGAGMKDCDFVKSAENKQEVEIVDGDAEPSAGNEIIIGKSVITLVLAAYIASLL